MWTIQASYLITDAGLLTTDLCAYVLAISWLPSNRIDWRRSSLAEVAFE